MFDHDYPQQRGQRSAMVTSPNPHFLKQCFPIQDDAIREFEPQSENFEMELKKFYSQGRRRSGRSTMSARVMVETALESGVEIVIATHEIDTRAGTNGQHELMGLCREYIEKLRREGVEIGIVKMTRDKMQLFLDKHSFGLYDRLKIENNPTKLVQSPFDRVALQKQLEFLNKRRLLLL
jgi:hypothetical protein